MENSSIKNTNGVPARFLWFLTFTYAMLITMASWFNLHIIRVFSLETNSGVLIFPLALLLLASITEIYGYKNARSAIWCGVFFSFIFILYGQAVVYLPIPAYAKHNLAFDMLLTPHIQLFVASCISCFISAWINSFLIAKFKKLLKGSFLGVRFALSNIVAISINISIFTLIGQFEAKNSQNFPVTILSIGLLTVVALPIFIYLTKAIKNFENIDIYDKKTNFNIFNFDVHYTIQDNEFNQGVK
jgi:uncharacterized integral membrane protein (TIGR00697 family)